tara:strand:+ start:2820 stop:3509 length:690 start_codon:yes stop_codon:yes gene_type:complete
MYKKHQYNTETGTKALEIALKTLKAKKVIIPTYTCKDVLTAVLNTSCEPIIVDCNEKLQIDVTSVLKVVNDADTIIIPHMFGIQNQVAPFKNFNLKIIEDLSQCHGLQGLGDFADIVVTSLNKSKWLDKKGGGYIWTDKNLNLDLSTDKMSDWDIKTKYDNRLAKAKELLNAGLDLIGKDIPNSWLRGMYFTGIPTRRPYIPLHEIYGKFDCPIVDSYSNKIDWISIFD